MARSTAVRKIEQKAGQRGGTRMPSVAIYGDSGMGKTRS